MATTRSKTAEAPAEEAKPAEATKQEGAKTEGKMVKVHNPHNRYHYVQPSTGIRIGANQTKDLREDGWLNLQVKAGVLEKA